MPTQEESQALFPAARDAVLVVDDARTFVDVNPAACRLLGLSARELRGRRQQFPYQSDLFVPIRIKKRPVGGHLVRLVVDLLDVARATAGKIALERRAVDHRVLTAGDGRHGLAAP